MNGVISVFGVLVASLVAMEFNLDPDLSSAQQSVVEEIVLESRAKLETVQRILALVIIIFNISIFELYLSLENTIIWINHISIFIVNCKWNDFGKWSDCSQDCGGGWQRRSRTVKQKAAFGGKQCDGCAAETRACNTHACPS